jgi:hypothetical protein
MEVGFRRFDIFDRSGFSSRGRWAWTGISQPNHP